MVLRCAAVLGLSLLVAPSCRKEASPDAGASGATAAPVVGAAALSAASAPSTANAGLDACLVGNWKASRVTLKVDPVDAQGGANIALQIAPSGASLLDFGPMSDIRATSSGFSFEFRYSGKATATLKTPSPGTVTSEQSDYSGLRVTASAKLPGAGSVALFKDTPLTQLANMGAALAGVGKGGAAKGAASAAAPAASGAVATPGIDSSPVFSSNRYTCGGDSLRLYGGEQPLEWVFERVRP
jgi:hypothetical protein